MKPSSFFTSDNGMKTPGSSQFDSNPAIVVRSQQQNNKRKVSDNSDSDNSSDDDSNEDDKEKGTKAPISAPTTATKNAVAANKSATKAATPKAPANTPAVQRTQTDSDSDADDESGSDTDQPAAKKQAVSSASDGNKATPVRKNAVSGTTNKIIESPRPNYSANKNSGTLLTDMIAGKEVEAAELENAVAKSMEADGGRGGAGRGGRGGRGRGGRGAAADGGTPVRGIAASRSKK